MLKKTNVITCLEIVEDQSRPAFEIRRILPAANLPAHIGSVFQCTVLNVRGPVVSGPYGGEPDIPTVKRYQFCC